MARNSVKQITRRICGECLLFSHVDFCSGWKTCKKSTDNETCFNLHWFRSQSVIHVSNIMWEQQTHVSSPLSSVKWKTMLPYSLEQATAMCTFLSNWNWLQFLEPNAYWECCVHSIGQCYKLLSYANTFDTKECMSYSGSVLKDIKPVDQ